MKLQRNNTLLRAKTSSAFTLIELTVTITISVFVIASIVTLAVISAQNYVATANYVRMNDQSRLIMDRISREIRYAAALTGYSQNDPQYLVFANSDGTSLCITNYAGSKTITLTTNNFTQTFSLPGCTNFNFQLYTGAASTTNVSYYALAPTPQSCRVVNLSWSCSQPITGSKLSTEAVQTAQVLLRNSL
jgi:type II secretory pathway pseudopilin PulG